MRQHLTPLAAALILALAASASATVLVPADLGELARSAVAIVRGRVIDVRPEWADGRRRVETIVTLQVGESYKGDLAGSVTFKVPGGVMGRYRSVMVGAPTFSEGEDVVLFLGARPPALPYVLGLGQGVFRVLRDPRTGQTSVTPPALLAEPGEVIRIERGDPSRRTLSLTEFSATVRLALTRTAVKAPRRPDRVVPAIGDVAPRATDGRLPAVIKGGR